MKTHGGARGVTFRQTLRTSSPATTETLSHRRPLSRKTLDLSTYRPQVVQRVPDRFFLDMTNIDTKHVRRAWKSNSDLSLVHWTVRNKLLFTRMQSNLLSPQGARKQRSTRRSPESATSADASARTARRLCLTPCR